MRANFWSVQEQQRDERRRELGVADDMAQIAGMNTQMMVALGENEIKTLDDFADCATDDLCGWVERSKEKGVEPVKHPGIFDPFDVSRQEAEEMILAARIMLGWINPEDLISAEPENPEAATEGEGQAEAEADGQEKTTNEADELVELPDPAAESAEANADTSSSS